MISPTELTGSHLRTHTSIFQHPVSHNLSWRDVHALLHHLGELEEQPNGNWKATRNGQTMMLHAPRTKDLATADEVLSIRRFVKASERPAAERAVSAPHLLLVINHHEACIYQTEIDGNSPVRILPHPAEDFFRHTHNSKDFSRGQEKPDPNSFFEPVAEALKVAGKILIFGSGSGMASEMEQFITWLKLNHTDIAARIFGSLVIDKNHLTEGELLAKAREYYANSSR